MSTYLLAFANGPFECLESAYTSPLSGIVRPLRMYGAHIIPLCRFGRTDSRSATPDLIDQCRFALEVKTKVLPIYERVGSPTSRRRRLTDRRRQMFKLEYPLPKLDTLVARTAQG
jgi:aminopeptidase 2